MNDWLDKEIQEFQELTNDPQKKDEIEAELMEQMGPVADQLQSLSMIVDQKEAELKLLKSQESELEDKIRKIWSPFIQGTSKAELKLPNGRVLSAEKDVNVTNDDQDKSVEWLTDHGYKDVLKYQVHHATLKKIAKDEYSRGTLIDGLKYFNYIKIKLK